MGRKLLLYAVVSIPLWIVVTATYDIGWAEESWATEAEVVGHPCLLDGQTDRHHVIVRDGHHRVFHVRNDHYRDGWRLPGSRVTLVEKRTALLGTTIGPYLKGE